VEHVLNPVLLFVCLAVAGVGIALALPRKGISPQILGALLAGGAFVVLFGALAVRAFNDEQLPNFNFYLFALIAIGSALRVISHPRPVYSALYFIITVLASAALYLIAHAEFMAFALVIIYAGAILITYLFVIMLATQAPSAEAVEALSDYDAYSREPLVGAGAGVTILVLVSMLLARGVGDLQPNVAAQTDPDLLANLPKKVMRELEARQVFDAFERPELAAFAGEAPILDAVQRRISLTVSDPAAMAGLVERPRFASLLAGEASGAEAEAAARATAEGAVAGEVLSLALPDNVIVTNAEGVGWALIAAHPMALELAGVILLMALVGAVVLARKQIELSEDEKARQARTLGQTMDVMSVGRGES
jgi:NADH-quinone oxidoreductase subunit J